MRICLGLGLALSLWLPTLGANDLFPDLSTDCYLEWQSRGWVIGEDYTPAQQVPRFADGIRKLCALRARMHASDASVSPYIQGRLAELAPYLFAADEQQLQSLIKKLQQRRPGHDFSGTFMRD